MLANNATILSVITLFGIHYHLSFFETKKFKRINWSLFLALILTMIGLGYFGKLDEVSGFVWGYYASSVGALVSFLICAALTILSGTLFPRRKCYLA
jgi:hypothetical protein